MQSLQAVCLIPFYRQTGQARAEMPGKMDLPAENDIPGSVGQVSNFSTCRSIEQVTNLSSLVARLFARGNHDVYPDSIGQSETSRKLDEI